MRKVIFESAISIDGFIEGPDGDMDWLICGEQNCNASEFITAFDTIFYGRKAYEKFGVLPYIGRDIPEAEREFYYSIGAMRKYVFSRTVKHVAGNGMVISEDLEGEVKRIREEKGKDIWFCGGADILQTFVDLDLVDEYILSVHPVLLRSGKPLFADNKKPLNLKLIDKHKLKSGVVILHYQPESRLNIKSYDGRSF
jgi:dihydrofolate reductase